MREDEAQIKRLFECANADPSFGERICSDPAFPERLHLSFSTEEILNLLPDLRKPDWEANPYLRLYRPWAFSVEEKICEVLQGTTEEILQYENNVRARMMAGSSVMGRLNNLHYYPVAFELSHGCSVGCPFCALDAQPLQGLFRYSGENISLWQAVLRKTYDLIGPAAAFSPCYFASEPLDNPDYEYFLMDIRKIMGRVPQTTTAVAERNPDRFRKLLEMLGEASLWEGAVRISIRTLDQMYEIMEQYLPSELVRVEMVLNNPEAMHVYSYSGRQRKAEKGKCDEPYSIACIAGFLIRMTDCSVRFVEPEKPSDLCPTGYRTLETRYFLDAEDFGTVIHEMMERYVRGHIRKDDLLFHDPDVTMTRDGFWFTLSSQARKCHLQTNMAMAGCLEEIWAGPVSVRALGESQHLSGFVLDDIQNRLDVLFRKGFLRCCPDGAERNTGGAGPC